MEEKLECFGDYDKDDMGCMKCEIKQQCETETLTKIEQKEKEVLEDIEKTLSLTKVQGEYIEVCPNCLSPYISIDKTTGALQAIGHRMGYKCNKCRNVFPSPIEILKDDLKSLGKNELLAENKKSEDIEKIDVSFGKFGVFVYFTLFWGIGLLIIGYTVSSSSEILGIGLMVIGLIFVLFGLTKRKRKS